MIKYLSFARHLAVKLRKYRKVKHKVKSTGIVRSVDELGRIVIPKEMRTKMNISSSDPIEIYVDGDKIILKKYENSCLFCGGSDSLTEFKGKMICSSCVGALKE